MSLLKKLTDGKWYCDICHEGREYDEISVMAWKVPDLPGCIRNIKYCNDDLGCTLKAQHSPFAKKNEE